MGKRLWIWSSRITTIEALEPKFAPFVTALRQFAREFEIGMIQEFVARYLNVEPHPEQHSMIPPSQVDLTMLHTLVWIGDFLEEEEE